MSKYDYEYHGLLAETWDLLRKGSENWPDTTHYRTLIERYGQPALDVGCGTGRILLPFLLDGIDVDGVDISPEMLALCRRKAGALNLSPTLYEQPMEELELPRKYKTIFVPSASFQLVTDLSKAHRALERFHSHLKEGGVLVLTFLVFDVDEGDTIRDWRVINEEVRPEDGAIVRKWAHAEFDLVNKLQHTENRYEIELDGALIASEEHRWSPATRWYSQEEAVNMVRQAGFNEVRLTASHSDEPAEADADSFWVLGFKS